MRLNFQNWTTKSTNLLNFICINTAKIITKSQIKTPKLSLRMLKGDHTYLGVVLTACFHCPQVVKNLAKFTTIKFKFHPSSSC